MLKAKVYYKDYVTGLNVFEGNAILLNRMDHRNTESFFELRFVDDNRIGCRWINHENIYEE
jgi:hypothetical protein